jgi:glycosyltransferase involved in cell wall biosynthesis
MELEEIQTLFRELRVCVLVPTYNNAGTLSAVLDTVLKNTSQVIVVNDGSTDKTSDILRRYPNIDCLTFKKNLGKGCAIREGFRCATSRGYDYAITIDSDGQHFAEDLFKFLLHIERSPTALVVGARNMDQEGIPGKSSFGNRFSNFWFWFETGIRMPDTQSGYRLYPLKRLSDIRFLTRKFEFEIEVLVRAAWKGIPIEHVPVRVYYPESSKRVSHFRPFIHITRISILNTILVFIALFYIKPRDLVRRLKKKASGISFGNNFSIPRSLIP